MRSTPGQGRTLQLNRPGSRRRSNNVFKRLRQTSTKAGRFATRSLRKKGTRNTLKSTNSLERCGENDAKPFFFVAEVC